MAGQECRTRLLRAGCVPRSEENGTARLKGPQPVPSASFCLGRDPCKKKKKLGEEKGHVVGDGQKGF